jgi:predicted DNA-binding protein YlxM (UPF0122 family)
MAMLYDFYGDVLTDKQREFFEVYHHDDLSLSEIAENAGITRQGVRDVITRAEAVLRKMESRLGLVKRYKGIQAGLDAITADARLIEQTAAISTGVRDAARRIASCAASLRD